jgi:ComEC/Rec2-related protein
VSSLFKIKPPKIKWNPLATVGTAVFTGSYVGASTQWAGLDLILLGATFFVLFFGVINTHKKPIFFITTAALLLFAASGSHQKKQKQWVSKTQNEIIKLKLLATSDSAIQTTPTHPMSEFDYRKPHSVFRATGYPENQNSEATNMLVVTSSEHNINKGDRVLVVGWFFESVKHEQHTFYASLPNQTRSGEQLKTTSILKNKLYQQLSQKEQTLFGAMFFGTRGEKWVEVSGTFRKAGMSHILAMSGMHIVIFIFVTNLFLLIRNKTTGLASLLLVICFSIVFVEIRTPLVRAIVMALVIYLIRCFGARCNTSSIISTALILVLYIEPKHSTDPSFQMTFIVVASLCVLLPQLTWMFFGEHDPVHNTKKAILRWLGSLWLTGACAWFSVAPIVAHLFGTMAPAGLLTSVPAVGLLFLSISLGCIQTAYCLVGGEAIIFLQNYLSAVLACTLLLGKSIGTVPHLYFNNIALPWIPAAMLVAGFVSWCLLHTHRKKTILFIIIALTLFYINIDREPITKITTIDVGHGTCHVIQSDGHTIVIDAGSRNNIDIAYKKINPTLRGLGVTTIDLLVITHADLDHVAGIIGIAESFTIKQIAVTHHSVSYATEPINKTIATAKKLGIQRIFIFNGWKRDFGELHLHVLSPSVTDKYRSTNASSAVIKMRVSGKNILFTGDIDESKIKEMCLQKLDIDILELPHHGQWSAESQLFVDTLCPDVIIQSTNIRRHAKDVWKIPMNTNRFVTATDGDITTIIYSDGSTTVEGSKNFVTMKECLSSKPY